MGNPYAPFASRLDWQLAQWAKLRGTGSTAFTELLAIEEVAERLALSYKNTCELNHIIDHKLPNVWLHFKRKEIILGGQVYECVESLFGDPDFASILLQVPERHYSDADCTMRVYFDMNTRKWWWVTQKELEKRNPGAMVIPIIISSDKMQLTVFGNKSAYPVYMTLGNLPKEVCCKPSRRGQILLAYLPMTHLKQITIKSACRRVLANLFHAFRESGMPIASWDGLVRHGHPILTVYVGDYPEQVLVVGCKTGECPKCPVPHDEVGKSCNTERPLRNLSRVLDALDSLDEGPRARSGRTYPTPTSTMLSHPDILYQLYQGIIKHLLAWLQEAYGEEEIHAHCHHLPPNHHLQQFTKGLSGLSSVTSKEHQDMCRILLGLIIGLPVPNGASPICLVQVTHAILDFLYPAQYTTQTSRTLSLLDNALKVFHANKEIFVDLGIWTHWHLPKLHSLDHYQHSIELFDMTDNYDMQYSECLHIDMAKEAYRVTNKKDTWPQMMQWLERREKILQHEQFVQWRLASMTLAAAIQVPSHAALAATDPAGKPRRHIEMTTHTTVKAVKHGALAECYGATYFLQLNHPHFTSAQQERTAASVYFHFNTILVFHKVKFWLEDPHGFMLPELQSVIHCRPMQHNKQGDCLPGRFDTTLWFTTFGEPSANHGLYKIKHSVCDHDCICPVEQLECSCHLLPEFGCVACREWTADNVLNECPVFFLNAFWDCHMYKFAY
ncbi:hypothetical protein OH76DRAFT_1459168 [Lentinus brumalis]|uniref:CxC2-like cysteine cluster KDZ transposase-associated domain-containing protein n=1 Tax=Lentinus brumalis TaxID=2498619 RepID=A0A371CME8_9APHY|nr:hypothetical protein OH76DRAFT_1459168 [Polyporus brumalis]